MFLIFKKNGNGESHYLKAVNGCFFWGGCKTKKNPSSVHADSQQQADVV